MRVQSDHWALILDFCEQHPQIITNKFNGQGGRNELNDLWRRLTIKLNSLGLGEKTVEGWKKTITDWKSKSKAKAGTINTHSSQTGGGEQCHLVLTSYEERLLAIMGKTSYEGNPANLERGLRKRKLFDESRDDEVAAIHSYSTIGTMDHTYPIPTSSSSQNNIFEDHDLPVASETIIMPAYDPIIRPTHLSRVLPSIHSTHIHSTSQKMFIPSTHSSKILPSVHSSQIPCTSRQILTPIKTKSNLEIPSNTNLTKVTSITHSPTISSPSIPHIATETINLTPVHLNINENTPQKTNVPGDKRRTRSKNDAEQLQKMHIELLNELKNINLNANSIAESLKSIASSLRK